MQTKKQIKNWPALAAIIAPLLFLPMGNRLILGIGTDLRAAPAEGGSKNVSITLISSDSAIQPGRELLLGLDMLMKPEWHTYWLNPGDAGEATAVQWKLPQGFQPGPILWPTPHLLPATPFMSYGYTNRTVLLTRIHVPPGYNVEKEIVITAKVTWVECKDICIPGKATLRLKLPVAKGKPRPNAAHAALLQKYLRKVPEASPWAYSMERRGTSYFLRFARNDANLKLPDTAYFFTQQKGIVESAAKQKLRRDKNSFTLELQADPAGKDKLKGSPSGILRTGNRRARSRSYAITPIRTGLSVNTIGAEKLSVGTALLFALIGGLILNLMPCVLPVLSIKIMSVAKRAGESRRRSLMHGLMLTLGILLSFWILAGSLLLLRAGGEELGWGFQLQSPAFIAFLAAFMFVFALNMLGIFEMGTSLIGVGSGSVTDEKKHPYGTSFMNGVLATVVATPCTAPFMGSALGFAMTQPAYISLVIFSALGLGMATPYILISAFPSLLRFLPKPGAWMESLKQSMGFFLTLAVIWLLWLLGRMSGLDVLAVSLGSLLLIAIAAWAYGRWAGPDRPLPTRIKALVAVLSLFLLAIGLYYFADKTLAVEPGNSSQTNTKLAKGKKDAINWIPFKPEQIPVYQAEGRIVFVDFTADWCLSCKVNEKIALHSTAALKRFDELNVVMMKADWTRKDPIISRTLSSFNRSGVPFYLIYPAGKGRLPIILPEILTPGIVLEGLQKASAAL